MRKTTSYLLKTKRSPDGIIFQYDDRDLFAGCEIKEPLAEGAIGQILKTFQPTKNMFLEWAKTVKEGELIQLEMKVTFAMFWDKYNDKDRSSKKRSERLWNKLDEANQVKAFYYIDTYNRHRGNADKKYCETYLAAEMWNNRN